MATDIITITVKCDLDNDEIFGRVHVQSTADKSLDWLLEEFCIEKRVKRKETFALRSAGVGELSLSKSIAQSGLTDGETIFAFNKDPPPPPPPPSTPSKGWQHWWLMAAVALIVGAVGVVAVVLIRGITLHSVDQYGIIVDIESDMSRVFLFTWPGEKSNGTGEIRIKGRADVATNIESTNGIRDLQSAVRLLASTVPQVKRQNATLLTGLTDWFQLLRQQNSSKAASLLQQLRESMPPKNSGLLSSSSSSAAAAANQLRVFSGQELAALSWITINYASDRLSVEGAARTAGQSFGLLELNPSTVRVAFVSGRTEEAVSGRNWRQLSVYGQEWGVYSNSYNCYGQIAAQLRSLGRSLLEAGLKSDRNVEFACWRTGRAGVVRAESIFGHPCAPTWYGPETVASARNATAGRSFQLVGSGDSSRCRLLISRFFNQTCTHSSCSFNDQYQPPLPADTSFLAVGAFADTADFFNDTASAGTGRKMANVSEFSLISDSYCSRRAAGNESSDLALTWRCFDALYVEQLLRSIGFNSTNWHQIIFMQQVNGRHLGKNKVIAADGRVAWSVGKMILLTNQLPIVPPRSMIRLLWFKILLAIFAFSLLLAVVFACMAIKNRKRRRGYKAF